MPRLLPAALVVGDLEAVEGEIVAVDLDHVRVAGRRALNLARTSGGAGDSDVITRSSRLRKMCRRSCRNHTCPLRPVPYRLPPPCY